MCHENDGLAQGAEDVAQFGLKIGADERIERAERLVKQQRVRIQHERAHQTDTLALPARKLVWAAIESLRRESRQIRQFPHARGDLIVAPAQIPRHQRDVPARGEVWEQSAVLDHVADAQPHRSAGRRIDRHAVEDHRTRVGPDEPDQEPQERRLPAAARPDQRGRLSGGKFQRERAERRPPRVQLFDAAQREHQAVTVTPFQNAR